MNHSIKIIVLSSVVGLLAVTALSGCINNVSNSSASNDDTLFIVTSIPPLYSITANVVDGASHIQLQNILPPNASPHIYSLTPNDAQTLESADVYIETGAGIEEFLEDALAENKDISRIQVNANLNVLASEDPDEPDDDPHIWVSIRNAILITQTIADELTAIDPTNTDLYQTNAANYIDRLKKLDTYAVTQLNDTAHKQFIPLHPSFAYFANDYGLEQIAAIEVIPGQEPSAQEIAELLTIIQENDVRALLSEPQLEDRILNSIGADTGLPIYHVDPLGRADLSKTLYEDTMKSNVDTFATALQ